MAIIALFEVLDLTGQIIFSFWHRHGKPSGLIIPSAGLSSKPRT
jgi:hypothetical protein